MSEQTKPLALRLADAEQERDALRAELEIERQRTREARDTARREQDRATELAAERGRLLAQEPVAWIARAADGRVCCWTSAYPESIRLARERGHDLQPLYAAPAAPVAQPNIQPLTPAQIDAELPGYLENEGKA